MIEHNIQYFDTPYKHVVIDDFFNEEDLKFVRNKLDTIKQSIGFDTTAQDRFILQSRKRKLAKDTFDYNVSDDRFAKYFKLADYLDLKQDTEKEYTSEYVYSFRAKPLTAEYYLHTEILHKGVTLVVYLSKEDNYGTEIFDNNKQFVKRIEWKYNRAVIMAGYDNQNGKLPGNSTWHTYKTKPNTIRETFFGFTICTKDSVEKHSLYSEHYPHKQKQQRKKP